MSLNCFNKLWLLIFVVASCSQPVRSPRAKTSGHHSERWYQVRWCELYGGKIEYVLPDRTRVDCLLPKYAVEFDFAKKWPESAGQALHYARMTKRKPGVVLILEKKKDLKYLKRLRKLSRANRPRIKIWTVGIAAKP